MTARTFRLPDLGEGLEGAEIAAWLVAEGDVVELNHPLVEVETAKATVEVPAPFAGRVLEIHAPAGSTVRVGGPLVTFEVEEEAPEPSGLERRDVRASPAVRALARERGVDLSGLAGTGPEGRVTREDLDAAAGEDLGRRAVTPLRRIAAERLTRAAIVPTVTTWRTVDCTALETVRAELGGSPLPLFVRALAEICTRHPSINASWSAEAILLHRRVNVGIATDTPTGLVVPVVRDADRLGVSEIAARIDELASSAREGTLTPEEMAGHTITVTNTGSYGSEAGTPLLNLPDAVIIALGAIAPRPIVVEGRVEARPACTLSVTFDHRVLDGADAGRALNDLVGLLQDGAALRALPS